MITKETKPFFDHFIDLKSFLLKVVLSVGVGSIISLIYSNYFISLITNPLKGRLLHFLSPTDSLFFLIKIHLFFGVLLSSPALLYFLWNYFKPILKIKERIFIHNYIFSGVILSVIGLIYAYFSLLPASLDILLNLSPQGTEIILTANNYIDFVISNLLIVILVFQTPIIVYSLIQSKLVNKKIIQSKRKVIYFSIIVLLAALTPTPDIISLILIIIPILTLFEIALFFAN
ncbi:MAG: preprotein translocase subunit TatC [Thermales bacterium]|nr:preprotein translocase subunit TatC [Thermales bacterium]